MVFWFRRNLPATALSAQQFLKLSTDQIKPKCNINEVCMERYGFVVVFPTRLRSFELVS